MSQLTLIFYINCSILCTKESFTIIVARQYINLLQVKLWTDTQVHDSSQSIDVLNERWW